MFTKRKVLEFAVVLHLVLAVGCVDENGKIVTKPAPTTPAPTKPKEVNKPQEPKIVTVRKRAEAKKEAAYGYRSSGGKHHAMLACKVKTSNVTAEAPPTHNTESYAYNPDKPFKYVADDPLSTFSIDVDTASYSNMRRMLSYGQLPPVDSVRIEEFINYFTYDNPAPTGGAPFNVTTELASCPWNNKNYLVRIALQAKDINWDNRPNSNIVFLLDVSGSMSSANKLPLVKKALQMLVNTFDERDRVAIVVYAGASGLVLDSTSCDNKMKIMQSLENLNAGGSTNGGAGIQLAYKVAMANKINGGNNRVILCTDGDFNVGTTDQGSLIRLIQEKAKSDIFLTVLGFGMGNYKDSLLEQIADKGNGNYGYVDSEREAKKMLVEQAGGTLITVAKDVKIQVEFNPVYVSSYRLVGYTNRMLAHQDFNDDKKDAGEIGAGHAVTALYEVIPAKDSINTASVDPLRYQDNPKPNTTAYNKNEVMMVKLRYKEPTGDVSNLIKTPVLNRATEKLSNEGRFAASVAMFAMTLRNSPDKGSSSFELAKELASSAIGKDTTGYRKEFLQLIDKAIRIKTKDHTPIHYTR